MNKKLNEKVKKILDEIDKDLIKPMSISERQKANEIIKQTNEKLHKKENKKLEKQMKHNMKKKPNFLVSIADLFQKIFHTIVTVFSMAGLLNFLFAWQVYKAVSSDGWQKIFHSKYSLYIIAYFAILFILKQIYYAFYRYANE